MIHDVRIKPVRSSARSEMNTTTMVLFILSQRTSITGICIVRLIFYFISTYKTVDEASRVQYCTIRLDTVDSKY